MQFREQLAKLGVCEAGLVRVGDSTLREWYEEKAPKRPETLAWLGMRLPETQAATLSAIFVMVNRALGYAAEALEKVQLVGVAATLRALPAVVDAATARAAAEAAKTAGVAAGAALAAGSAARKALPVRDAAAATASVWVVVTMTADQTAVAAYAATVVADTASAAWGAAHPTKVSAQANVVAENGRVAERAQQYIDLRAALPLEVLEAALAKATQETL